jgi:hypothetical protein
LPAQNTGTSSRTPSTPTILTLVDTFELQLANADGEHSVAIEIGDPIAIYIADPTVNGGTRNLILMGRCVASWIVFITYTGRFTSVRAASFATRPSGRQRS